jgi:dTMP kinase
MKWCAAPDAGLPAPDITLFLDVAPEVQRARGGFGEERYENAERQARVREAFAHLRDHATPAWVRIDAGNELDVVERDIWGAIMPVAAGIDGELNRLWSGYSTIVSI